MTSGSLNFYLWSDGRGMAHGVYNRLRDLFVRRNTLRFGGEWRFTILGFEYSISPLCFLGPHWWLWMDVLSSRDGRGKLEKSSSNWPSLIPTFSSCCCSDGFRVAHCILHWSRDLSDWVPVLRIGRFREPAEMGGTSETGRKSKWKYDPNGICGS